jgi:hypothetical protein
VRGMLELDAEGVGKGGDGILRYSLLLSGKYDSKGLVNLGRILSTYKDKERFGRANIIMPTQSSQRIEG